MIVGITKIKAGNHSRSGRYRTSRVFFSHRRWLKQRNRWQQPCRRRLDHGQRTSTVLETATKQPACSAPSLRIPGRKWRQLFCGHWRLHNNSIGTYSATWWCRSRERSGTHQRLLAAISTKPWSSLFRLSGKATLYTSAAMPLFRGLSQLCFRFVVTIPWSKQ